MLRQRENPESVKAGVFSVLVHVLLLGALLISFNWKTTHPISIAQVELWDSIPAPQQQPVSPPEPELPPVEKVTPKPEHVAEPIAKPESQVEIAIEKKPVEKKIEKPVKKDPPKLDVKVEDARKKLLDKMRQEDLKKESKVSPPPNRDAIKKMQQELLNEDKAAGEQKAASAKSAASAGVVDEYVSKIKDKIRGHVNKTLCGDGNPELKFEIGLLPSGELSGSPKIAKSSGSSACDAAVERAIQLSEPLDVPKDPTIFSQFRNLKLTFRPNEN
jgi:colicin import membrane protein